MVHRELRKPRESHRELRAFERSAAGVPDAFPAPHPGRSSWWMNLPVAERVVDGPKARTRTRRACIERLLTWSERVRTLRPPDLTGTRVFALIALPELFDSSIDVIYSDDEWKRFLTRDSPEYSWQPLPPDRDFFREWRIDPRPWQHARGFRQVIDDEGQRREGELWLVGETGP